MCPDSLLLPIKSGEIFGKVRYFSYICYNKTNILLNHLNKQTMMSEQFLNDIFDSICEVQSKNPPNTFGSYGNFLNTTIDWGIREHFKQSGMDEVKDSLVDKITDEVKYQYF